MPGVGMGQSVDTNFYCLVHRLEIRNLFLCRFWQMAVGAVSEGDSTTNYNITNNVSEDHNPQHSQSLIAPASARNSGPPASASSTWSDAVDQQTDLVTTYWRCASYQAEY